MPTKKRIVFPSRHPLPFVAAFGLFVATAASQTTAYDGFGNGPLADLANSTGGTGWSGAWVDAGTDPTAVAATGLQYAGLATTAGAAVTPVATGVYPTSTYERAFALPPAATTLYVSFLLRADSPAAAWGGLTFGHYPYAMNVGAPPGYYAFGLMTSQGLGNVATKPLVVGETTLVVLKVVKNAPGAGTTWSLYLDPAVGSPEPGYPAASYGLGPVPTLPTQLALDNSTGFTTDEIRVGTSWNAVLPVGPSPWTDFGFGKPGYLGAPHLVGSGPLTGNSTNTLQLSNASPSSLVVQGIGITAINVPYLGGVLVPDPVLVNTLATDANGAAIWQLFVPTGVPSGLPLVFQHWVQDPLATYGWSASNGLRAIVQ